MNKASIDSTGNVVNVATFTKKYCCYIHAPRGGRGKRFEQPLTCDHTRVSCPVSSTAVPRERTLRATAAPRSPYMLLCIFLSGQTTWDQWQPKLRRKSWLKIAAYRPTSWYPPVELNIAVAYILLQTQTLFFFNCFFLCLSFLIPVPHAGHVHHSLPSVTSIVCVDVILRKTEVWGRGTNSETIRGRGYLILTVISVGPR